MEKENTCNHDCSSCKKDCSSRIEKLKLNKLSNVKHLIGVVSGKGGVGKSFITSLLATGMNRLRFNTAILDADITGPSIPKMFGIKGTMYSNDDGMFPAFSKTGIQIMSTNLLLEKETQPVIWRGPVIANLVSQFWTDVIWNQVDYMFVDMPPGTGDVPLTVFQSLPVEGIIVVTSPQELVSMIVEKAVNMANMVNVPILGIVENFSYFICPNCQEKHNIFGDSKIEEIAKEHNIDTFAKLPIISNNSKLADNGEMENVRVDEIIPILDRLKTLNK